MFVNCVQMNNKLFPPSLLIYIRKPSLHKTQIYKMVCRETCSNLTFLFTLLKFMVYAQIPVIDLELPTGHRR